MPPDAGDLVDQHAAVLPAVTSGPAIVLHVPHKVGPDRRVPRPVVVGAAACVNSNADLPMCIDLYLGGLVEFNCA